MGGEKERCRRVSFEELGKESEGWAAGNATATLYIIAQGNDVFVGENLTPAVADLSSFTAHGMLRVQKGCARQ
jgi:hypothetical protein